MQLFDFHITHTPIGPIAQSLTRTHTHTCTLTVRPAYIKCGSVRDANEETVRARNHLEWKSAALTSKQERERERGRENRRLTAGYAGSAARVQRKRKSKRESENRWLKSVEKHFTCGFIWNLKI